jgi:hypothetical protein
MTGGPGSSVGIATDYGLDGPGIDIGLYRDYEWRNKEISDRVENTPFPPLV